MSRQVKQEERRRGICMRMPQLCKRGCLANNELVILTDNLSSNFVLLEQIET